MALDEALTASLDQPAAHRGGSTGQDRMPMASSQARSLCSAGFAGARSARVRLQLLHESELKTMRQELVPGIDANLSCELTTLDGLRIERKDRGAVRLAFCRRG